MRRAGICAGSFQSSQFSQLVSSVVLAVVGVQQLEESEGAERTSDSPRFYSPRVVSEGYAATCAKLRPEGRMSPLVSVNDLPTVRVLVMSVRDSRHSTCKNSADVTRKSS